VKATELTRDFLTNRKSAEEKYTRGRWGDRIIIEGVVSELVPEDYTLYLKGAAPTGSSR